MFNDVTNNYIYSTKIEVEIVVFLMILQGRVVIFTFCYLLFFSLSKYEIRNVNKTIYLFSI